VFSLSQRINEMKVKILLADKTLNQVSSYKYLGIEFDSKLSFANHVSKTVAKSNRGIAAICRLISKWAPKGILQQLIGSKVMPALLYGIELWFPPDIGKKKMLAKVQKFGARLVTNNFRPNELYKDLISQVDWIPLHHLVAIKRLLTMKKYAENLRFAPAGLFVHVQLENVRKSRRLLAKSNHHDKQVQIPFSKSLHAEKLAPAQYRKLWNALDQKLVSLPFNQFASQITDPSIMKMLEDVGALEQLEDF
jgi:hypothetical protein